MPKVNLKTAAALICFVFIVLTYVVTAAAQTQASLDQQSLRAFLQTKADDKDTRYVAIFRDLNGDDTPEALAYLVGNEWCGSGGCNLFVLQKAGNSWTVVSSVSITFPPVQLLSTVSNGWRDLRVHVGGGGALPDVVTLRFNGKTYRKRPLGPKTSEKPSGEVIIGSWEAAKPLF
jgi:hypothetical protein